MRALRNPVAVLLLTGVLGIAFSTAQQSKVVPAPTAVKAPLVPLLGAEDGLAVLASALDFRNRASEKADCSHLVHDIYERAGFAYEYVTSNDLYTGTDEFRRVTRPQPGDLIAWPGHVGIVVSPTRHTFYSSLTSGLGVESYDSDYWKRRGHPHFLRFVKDAATAVASNVKTPALKTTSLETKTPSGTLEVNDVDDPQPLAPVTPPAKLEPVQFPRLLVVDSARPTAEEVSETVTNALNNAAESMKGHNIFQQPQTFVVLRDIQVEKVKLKGATGWADVVTTESASLTSGQSNLKKRQQKQRWILRRRDGQSWDLVPPQGTVYLNQDDAVRLMSQQLATITAASSSADGRQKGQLAALLGALLQVKN
ncbi:MAG TPA: NlpC/P60 family protein [Terriglobales bacterium]